MNRLNIHEAKERDALATQSCMEGSWLGRCERGTVDGAWT